jgi:hypothetical protein
VVDQNALESQFRRYPSISVTAVRQRYSLNPVTQFRLSLPQRMFIKKSEYPARLTWAAWQASAIDNGEPSSCILASNSP